MICCFGPGPRPLAWRASALVAIFLSLSPIPPRAQDAGPAAAQSQILGRPTDHSIVLSVLSATTIEARVVLGSTSGMCTVKTPTATAKAGVPVEIEIGGLQPNSRYYYRLETRPAGPGEFRAGPECRFQTSRSPGSAFTFALQGDSHPERAGKMYDPDLYAQTLRNVAQDRPDFYVTLGDDFSIDRLISRQTLSQAAVDQVYARQRAFLDLVGSSSPLFLVNGNHEQAGRWLLDGTETNPAVMAGRARTRFYPLPAPDGFYGGDAEMVEPIGLLRDYYSWTWGDALFVVLDPYWHSPVQVDHDVRGSKAGQGEKDGKEKRDLWGITLGDTQYRWLAKTLTESSARFKFVFAHHVLGTGRGGIELADQFEWGGKDKKGSNRFAEKRPGWKLPIHALMVQAGVTIFFQGHDHLYARQELDGVVYQSTPNPADRTYQAFNREAYRSGEVLPNSGHLRVTVAPETVRVDYVGACLPSDERSDRTNGAVAHTYTLPARPTGARK